LPGLGILGGTFDPPHNGHIAIAEAALKKLNLEKILLIPAKLPPHKSPDEISSDIDRLEMLKLAVQERPDFEISEIELKRPGLSYTIHTLKELRRIYPDKELVFIIGADNISEMETWYQPDAILDMAAVAAFNRPGFSPKGKYASKIELFEMIPNEISSTAIREAVKSGKAIAESVPISVEKYIIKKSLYKAV